MVSADESACEAEWGEAWAWEEMAAACCSSYVYDDGVSVVGSLAVCSSADDVVSSEDSGSVVDSASEVAA